MCTVRALGIAVIVTATFLQIRVTHPNTVKSVQPDEYEHYNDTLSESDHIDTLPLASCSASSAKIPGHHETRHCYQQPQENSSSTNSTGENEGNQSTIFAIHVGLFGLVALIWTGLLLSIVYYHRNSKVPNPTEPRRTQECFTISSSYTSYYDNASWLASVTTDLQEPTAADIDNKQQGLSGASQDLQELTENPDNRY